MIDNKGRFIDLNVEDVKAKKADKTRFMIWLAVLVCAAVFVLLVVGSVGRFVLPFKPLVIQTYDFSDPEACPGDLVDLATDRYIDDSFVVDSIHIESYWLLKGDMRPYLPYSYDLTEDELVANRGSALRVAPFTSGEWYIHTEFLVEGRVLGFVPRTEDFEISTSSYLYVPADIQSCAIKNTEDARS